MGWVFLLFSFSSNSKISLTYKVKLLISTNFYFIPSPWHIPFLFSFFFFYPEFYYISHVVRISLLLIDAYFNGNLHVDEDFGCSLGHQLWTFQLVLQRQNKSRKDIVPSKFWLKRAACQLNRKDSGYCNSRAESRFVAYGTIIEMPLSICDLFYVCTCRKESETNIYV